MKKSILLLLTLILVINFNGNTQTALNLGDVAFTGVNTDAPDDWTFIFLVSVTSGTTVTVTDEGWFAAGGFRSGPEQTITWTATEAYACGTQITIDGTNATSNDGGYGTSGTVSGTALSLSIGGEALHMYQGAAPTAGDQSNFITSIQVNGGGWDADATSNTTSAKPSVMTDGINSMSFSSAEVDNQTLNPGLCGSITAVSTVIYTESNWTRFNDHLTTPACTSILGGLCGPSCTDPTVPTITAGSTTICPGASTTLDWSGAALNDATNWHIYTGSCGVGQLGPAQPGSSLVVSPAITTTYYIRGEDGAGCVDESTGACGSITITVEDVTPPTITCPANQIGVANGACVFLVPDYTSSAAVADNCTASPAVTQSPLPGTSVGPGTTVITLTATDGSANTANCNFNLTVSDITPPTITCPGNQVGTVDGTCNFTLLDYTSLATAADNCSGVVVTQVPAAGTIVGTGTTNVVLTATDGGSNSVGCNFDVVVTDVTNPTIACPGNQVGSVDGFCQYLLPDYTGSATVADNCSGVTVTQVPAAGTTITGGTVVTLTATDASSNTASCNFNSIGTDAVAPTAVCQNINAYLDGAGNVTIVAADIDGGSTDNCGSITLSASQIAFTCANLGPNNVTLTVTDVSTNSANCVAVVTVIDTISPVTTCPGNQTETPDALCNFTLPDYTS